MKRSNVAEMTVNQLTDQFVAIALEQDKALFDGETSKFNKLYDQMEAITSELKSRPGDRRSTLLPLYAHPNNQVRLKAAIVTLDIAPEGARAVLQGLADSRRYPQAADALTTLRRLDGRPLV
jgi:hypothetical protein